jgi:uroporphyrinogen decarboxylase
MAALSGEYADRVPISVEAERQFAPVLGVTMNEFGLDPEKALQCLIAAHEVFPSDTVSVPGAPYQHTTVAARQQVLAAEQGPPRPRLEEKSDLAKLRIPNPREHRRYAPYLEMCRKVTATFKDTWVQAGAPAPWMIATTLRGPEQVIYDTVDDPHFVHELMRYCTELTKAIGEAIAETGVNIFLAETTASCSLISPKIYHNFVQPYLEETVNSLKEKRATIDLHICGYIDPIIEDLISLGVDIIDLDSPSSLKRLVEVSQKKVVIRGNVATDLFVIGTREQIESSVRECIETAAEGSAFILSPGCMIPDNAQMKNIQYFWEAGLEYGRYS